jgi:hypothetical protein
VSLREATMKWALHDSFTRQVDPRGMDLATTGALR